ncbi:uncharacterized protein I303_103779 [Kwoniella dejecticola CBS 10117]|uniref:Uncharacterized protein n=1 Tax=Kwoniella dejecticola CBS 10117 TaxID=1296121 RepID=A0A1A6A7P5_9TREE|nr:uncharacterized protein I303_03797 [Kwoniella dejecticola CBS 10117]OBR86079.1 hypothetical protein I303_03797 [Kwoniella dejecticola CBS 10117]
METPTKEGSPIIPQQAQMQSDTPVPSGTEGTETPIAGPSTTPAPAANKRIYTKKSKPKVEGLMAYTSAFVPGTYNIKIPAGDYLQKERNLDVARQMSLARAKQEKADSEAEREKRLAEGQEPEEIHPLHHTLIIHPGSRNLRIGRASDFYPKEIPNCIARPATAANRGHDPPVPGSRAKRIATRAMERRNAKRRKGDDQEVDSVNGNGYVQAEDSGEDDGEGNWVDPVDTNIGHLREYLRNRLVQERLATDWKEGTRVRATNAKVRPENLPEHNDPYRIDWTESDGRPFYIGAEALRLPEKAGYKVRYPILQRSFNKRDWTSSQLLLDDISTIIQESLRTELGVTPKDYHKYSVVFIIPDHGDRNYVETMTNMFMTSMAFKEIAVHQEAYCAIFSAGMSSACVVDIGAQSTSVTLVDEGLLNQDTRIKLNYGGDDITSALVTLLQRSNFPYRELDLAKSQEWIMMDNLKNKICTLEEHLVANTPWDFYVLKTEGLTQKYVFRTYDENILAPLIFFDTRLIDFKEKKGHGAFRFWGISDEKITGDFNSSYEEPTGAMRACTTHLLPSIPAEQDGNKANGNVATSTNGDEAKPANGDTAEVKPAMQEVTPAPPSQAGSQTTPAPEGTTPVPTAQSETPIPPSKAVVSELSNAQVLSEACRSPLDAAVAASISMAGTENKAKTAANSILLIGGGSSLKGLGVFIADRLPPLLRQKGLPISDVSIVPPPRGLNPRFVSWKGASVMCNLESLNDMWIRKDEWDAIGIRALKDRYLFY